jgi:hypothetical protein
MNKRIPFSLLGNNGIMLQKDPLDFKSRFEEILAKEKTGSVVSYRDSHRSALRANARLVTKRHSVELKQSLFR